MKLHESYEAKFPQRIRILPQWLIDLVDGDTDSSINRSQHKRNKTIKSGVSSELVTCHDKYDRTEGNSIVLPCSSHGELNNRAESSIKIERNAHHMEALVKTDPDSFKGGIKNINQDVIKQEPATLPCVKEKYDSDEREDELDLNTSVPKSSSIEDTACNKELFNITGTCGGTECLEGRTEDRNQDTQEPTTLSCVKEKYDSDETEDEFDLNTSVPKSSSAEDSACKEESLNVSRTGCFEEGTQDINQDMLMLEQTSLSLGKEKCNSVETEDEFDLNTSDTKSRNVEDSDCNQESLIVTSTSTFVNADTSSSVISLSATCSGDPGTDVNNVNENDNTQTSTNQIATTQIMRTKCKYGTGCYRKNSQHRQDFSHPGDDDYTTLDNRPECEYGLSCYRKNPLHRQHFKHTKKVQKPRQAKRPKKVENDESDDEDDYDLEDPFINDGSSDDYEPSSNESEMDASEDEGANSGENGSDLQVQETKKLKRKRGH